MKTIIYPVAIIAGIYASLNTMSLVLGLQNKNAHQLISKVKHKIMIHETMDTPYKSLCKTELKTIKMKVNLS